MKVCQGDAHGGFCLTEVLSCRCWVTIRNEFVVEVKMECFQNSWGNPPHEDLFTWDVCKISATKWSACCSFVVVTSSLAISWYIYIYFFCFCHSLTFWPCPLFNLTHFFRGWSNFLLEKMDKLTAGGLLFVEEEGWPEETGPRLGRFVFIGENMLKNTPKNYVFVLPPCFFLGLIEGLIFFFFGGGWADEWARFECQLVKGLAGFKFEWWGRGCVLAGIVSISMGVDICVICWLF